MNIIKAVQVQNPYTGKWITKCDRVCRYAQNVRVQFYLDDLQNPFEAHIGKNNMIVVKATGHNNLLEIPDEYFTTYDPVIIWVMSSADTGEPNKRTKYCFTIPIKRGTKEAVDSTTSTEENNEEEE